MQKPRETLRAKERLWITGGVAAAGMPCVVQSVYALWLGIIAPILPAQFSLEALAVALIICAILYDERDFIRQSSVVFAFANKTMAPVFAALLAVDLFCNTGILLNCRGLLGDFDHYALALLATCSQAAFLVLWMFYGLFCLEEDDRDDKTPAITAGHFFLVGALWQVVLFVGTFLPFQPFFGILLCAASAYGAARCLGLIARSSARGLCSLALLGGILSATGMRELVSDLIEGTYFTIDPLVVLAACACAYAVLLAVTAILFVRADQQAKAAPKAQAPTDPAVRFVERLSAEAELSDRQQEVLKQVALGCSATQISANLGLALGTIRNHRDRALAKLGMNEDELRSAYQSFLQITATKDGEQERRLNLKHALAGTAGLAAMAGLSLLCPSSADSPFAQFVSGSCDGLVAFALGLPLLHSLYVRLGTNAPSNNEAFLTRSNTLSRLWLYAAVIILAQLLFVIWRREWPGFAYPLFFCVIACILIRLQPGSGGDCPKTPGSLAISLVPGLAFWNVYSHHPIIGILTCCSLMLAEPLWMAGLPYAVFVGGMLIVCFALALSLANAREQERFESRLKPEPLSPLGAKLGALGLSDLESQIAILIDQGYTSEQIQKKLLVAPGTVNSYRAAIYRKLNIHRAPELKERLKELAG